MDQLPVILKKARTAKGLTQEEVAKKLGISQRAYAFYEDEERTKVPKPKRLGELGKVLDIPIKSLLKFYNTEIEENTSENITSEGKNEDNGSKAAYSSTDRLLDQIEARRQDFEKWAELARQDKEKAEKEKDRLLNIIENNLTLLIQVVKSVDSNSKLIADDISALTKEVQAEHRAIMDTVDKAAKQPIGTTRATAGKLELASHQVNMKTDKKAGAHK